jgi:hypothetical protein
MPTEALTSNLLRAYVSSIQSIRAKQKNSGIEVMILKKFPPKRFGEKMAILTQIPAI